MSDVPLEGRTLVVGPSNVGKTAITAAALERWLERDRGPDGGTVVLEFAPERERDGRLIGGRIERFAAIPGTVHHAVMEPGPHAPRSDGETDADALRLAKENADRARGLFDRAPADPAAVFVNDATIPFQADGDPEPLVAYCADAEVVVANAFAGTELGVGDPVSRNERAALRALRGWADRVVEPG